MIELHAPAKINLTLEVLKRRADGYHTIASVMHTLSLHDTLILTPIPKRRPPIILEVGGFAVPTDERNLIWRALEQVGATAQSGWHVRLIKRIPPQGGLGGGSSDAAAIVRYFMGGQFHKTLPPSGEEGAGEGAEMELLAIARQLGSDVPFFLKGACARVGGRGEQVQPLPALPPFWWVLAQPPDVGVSTAWAYAQLSSRLEALRQARMFAPTETLAAAIRQGAIQTPEQLAPLLHNDFEAVVLDVLEPLQQLRARMESLGAIRVLLCGSGAAQGALCAAQSDAERIASILQSEGYWAVAAQLGL